MSEQMDIEGILRRHRAARPNRVENPAWANCHKDLGCCADFISTLRALVAAQAEDEGLWFQAATCPEAYLQQELRYLHGVIEGTIDPYQEVQRGEKG